MSEWEERVTSESSPARRLEHELRYRLVAPLVRDAPLWADLGCGTGVAAADGLGSDADGRALLVDNSAEALEQASRELPALDATTLHVDLGTHEGVNAVRDALTAERDTIVTCFETLAHLENFVPCVDFLIELGTTHTVVLSVPNDAFWSIDNPFHPTSWGEGAFEELRRLLPGEHVHLEQVSLAGSAIAPPGPAELSLAPARLESERVPSHYLLAFGPRAARLEPLAGTRMQDADEERRWERKRTSELALMSARLRELESAT
jgi:hypothetical protein